MSIAYDKLESSPRLLIEVELKPVQGDRFQPTGFPDLGAARYTAPDGREMLLVESAQSVANRMEMACWDSTEQDLIIQLRGLPYIKIVDKSGVHVSNTLLESHRINSEYILKHKNAYRVVNNNEQIKTVTNSFNEEFAEEIEFQKDGRVNWNKLWEALLKYDINSLIHGCFLEEIGGRLRVTRSLSAFIEASNINIAESGGTKHNIVQPGLKGGEGNVIYPRTEFTAKKIIAYFNIDLSLLRSYGLPEEAFKLMIALALFKIRRFLSTGLRLRTACDLEPVHDEINVTRPTDGFDIPAENELLSECQSLIAQCKDHFANPPVTVVQWNK